MKSSQIVAVVIATIFSSNLYAQNTLFIPVGNQPIMNNSVNTSSVSYGLTDDEIARRIENGLANTIPISVLVKWQNKQQKQNSQDAQLNIITPVLAEQPNPVVVQPVLQPIKQSFEQQPLPMANTPMANTPMAKTMIITNITKADPMVQEKTTFYSRVSSQHQINTTTKPTLTTTEPAQSTSSMIDQEEIQIDKQKLQDSQ